MALDGRNSMANEKIGDQAADEHADSRRKKMG
jgi:hypothetical protein